MMNSFCKTACTLTVLAIATSSVMAADSVDLKVIGTITPAACLPTIVGGKAVDYGDIRADELVPATYHDLGIQSVDFTVTCDAPAKFAIKATNARGGSVVSDTAEGVDGFAPAPINLFGAASVPAAGLGLDGTAKIGGFSARIQNVEIDDGSGATAADVISSVDNGANWKASATAYITENAQILSWAAPTTIIPIAATSLTATLEVNAYLNKPEAFEFSKAVNLDGLTTIEIVYL
ncbi:DUF1120 domain-containing protein [Acinetobacter calcoaceticus]|uniref:DUF1120 domain-containing protein n=1 Tax=Acinetobacter calcoaceticus TaxID=471 RepID=UPI00192B66AD|nr:DUF1120 domain-containing protein [Acinetobacter calcoaceticus]